MLLLLFVASFCELSFSLFCVYGPNTERTIFCVYGPKYGEDKRNVNESRTFITNPTMQIQYNQQSCSRRHISQDVKYIVRNVKEKAQKWKILPLECVKQSQPEFQYQAVLSFQWILLFFHTNEQKQKAHHDYKHLLGTWMHFSSTLNIS